MATTLWGKVYYNENYAGALREEPGGRCTFTYDQTYLDAKHPAIAFTLPLQPQPHISEHGLHSFFDNLVAEGWLRNAQARAIKIDPANRFALLLAFGHDCAGAVSVLDPSPAAEPAIDLSDPATAAALSSRASLSGIQPKVLAVKDGKGFRPARRDETSTYIAKLPSGALRDIVENEFITTSASRALLPDDDVVEAEVGTIESIEGRALLVRRFDRLPNAKVHFEEFNQLFGRRSGDDKYAASYEEMGKFIRTTPACAPADAWRLYRRILVCILTGNTDAHLKNFAMFHTRDGLRLTPAYDLVAAAAYPEYQQLALSISAAANLRLADIKAKHIVGLGRAYDLNEGLIAETIQKLDRNRKAAEKAVTDAANKVGAVALGHSILDVMEHRWNGTFSSIGQFLSKKPSAADTA